MDCRFPGYSWNHVPIAGHWPGGNGIIFLTEVTSNTATTAAFLPPLGALAVSLGMDPAMLAIPAAMCELCLYAACCHTAQCHCLWVWHALDSTDGSLWPAAEPQWHHHYYSVMSLAGGKVNLMYKKQTLPS